MNISNGTVSRQRAWGFLFMFMGYQSLLREFGKFPRFCICDKMRHGMKTKQTLQIHQTIWSVGRINWLQRYEPLNLIELYQTDQLIPHLLMFNKQAVKVLTDLQMFTPDKDAWDETMRRIYPEIEKASLKIKKSKMAEINDSLGLTKKIINLLIKDRDKYYNKL
jgi:hypothetical protein